MSSTRIDTTRSVIVLQEADAFDGTQVGRASVTIGGLAVTGFQIGDEINGYRLVTNTAGNAVLYDADGKMVATIQAAQPTWESLAAAINKISSANVMGRWVRASVTTPGSITAEDETFAGGVAAVIDGGGSRYRFVSTGNGGLFYFDQDTPCVITQIEGVFADGSGDDVTLKLVNLDDGFQPISGESFTFFAGVLGDANDFSVINDVQLNKYRALLVQCGHAGKVQVNIRQESLVARV